MLKKFVEIVAKLAYKIVVKWLSAKAKKAAWFLAAGALLCLLGFAFTLWWPLVVAGLSLAGLWGLILLTLKTLKERN